MQENFHQHIQITSVTSHKMGWLNKIFKGSTHKIVEGHSHGKYGDDKVWYEHLCSLVISGLALCWNSSLFLFFFFFFKFFLFLFFMLGPALWEPALCVLSFVALGQYCYTFSLPSWLCHKLQVDFGKRMRLSILRHFGVEVVLKLKVSGILCSCYFCTQPFLNLSRMQMELQKMYLTLHHLLASHHLRWTTELLIILAISITSKCCLDSKGDCYILKDIMFEFICIFNSSVSVMLLKIIIYPLLGLVFLL